MQTFIYVNICKLGEGLLDLYFFAVTMRDVFFMCRAVCDE